MKPAKLPARCGRYVMPLTQRIVVLVVRGPE
mgnify:CR=1 FL=1